MTTAGVLRDMVAADWRRLLLWGLGFAIGFQIFMLAALMLRFQALPNYVTFYNWPGNVWTIIQSTPAWSDVFPIAAEEWLIEIGQMNYDYGTGISVWSLNVIPYRMAMVFVLGVLVALALRLSRKDSCGVVTARSSGVATGIGAVLVAMTNATMSWVVCCAAPNWVVGLAMMGLGVSTSLALERTGPAIGAVGFAILCALIVWLAWRKAHPARPQERKGLANA